jgi:gamma-D-glutamyl-L-lysine dipeptidyl-peptidase
VAVLGERDDWRYIQGADQYFGWVALDDLAVFTGYGQKHVVAVLLADVRDAPRSDASVIARLPAGTAMPATGVRPDGWSELHFGPGWRTGYVAPGDVADIRELPHHYPTADDYLKTAESFIGIPYLWGGTTALGLDCSGLVQQVYRLNGVALPRDADQQAMLGRRVDEARAGDLMFFGAQSVTHVALATSATEFIHAPMKGGVVEHSRLGGDRKLLGIRRYLPDLATS